MLAASVPVQRPPGAKLLAVDRRGHIRHCARSEFVDLLRPGDLVVANDAGTIPASLSGQHRRTGRPIEVRLAARDTLGEARHFSAVVFGEGDFHIRTEDRPKPPLMLPGDVLELGPLQATVERLLDHPRLLRLQFDGSPAKIREGLARHGRPIQYAHVAAALALWDTWTPIAGPPVAFEPPSAGFILTWSMLGSMTERGVRFATITHAAGISSTGDAELDARLPFDEPYRISSSTALAIQRAKARGARIIAIGTTVVRALEHAASVFDGSVPAGDTIENLRMWGRMASWMASCAPIANRRRRPINNRPQIANLPHTQVFITMYEPQAHHDGLATQRIGASSRLRVVDAILSGVHERGASHYEMLRAFASDCTLDRMDRQLNAFDYRTHEFGDSVFIERAPVSAPCR